MAKNYKQEDSTEEYSIESHGYLDACCNDVKQGSVSESAHKSYLGHFAHEKYLKQGHNTSDEAPLGIFDPFSKKKSQKQDESAQPSLEDQFAKGMNRGLAKAKLGAAKRQMAMPPEDLSVEDTTTGPTYDERAKRKSSIA